jgi:hypothetical protein
MLVINPFNTFKFVIEAAFSYMTRDADLGQ